MIRSIRRLTTGGHPLRRWAEQRDDHRRDQNTRDNHKRCDSRIQDIGETHFHPDKNQDRGEAVVQRMETLHDSSEGEIENRTPARVSP